jgi:hypothetical protein
MRSVDDNSGTGQGNHCPAICNHRCTRSGDDAGSVCCLVQQRAEENHLQRGGVYVLRPVVRRNNGRTFVDSSTESLRVVGSDGLSRALRELCWVYRAGASE